MRSHRVRRLLVKSRGKLSGIVTQSNLLQASRRLLQQYESQHSQLAEEASLDGLTGLYNRRSFERLFAREINRLRRYGGELALVLFDLDHFKQVNDQHGHLTGDRVLRAFGGIVRRTCREVDVPARIGGEEFAVLLPAVGARAARVFAERVRIQMARPRKHGSGLQLRTTVSAGIGEWNRSISSAQELMRLADDSLYMAKRSGRDRVGPCQTPEAAQPPGPGIRETRAAGRSPASSATDKW
jgi:diguanylate cyclase (GGDEF)-like protein